ncbi:unnamed protein product [Triticum turgidum subsp. durum]|uniref:C2H2-type domain-containing protein n=1 Tax=Triticum turgidum subsp. durum TaxID=4567 RepID=A0A9R0VQP0_TRITD|nr:unnamed protein product [Triticum turgidum subsp. durum]
MTENHRFWGVVVKPGETVKCDPGDSHYHISTIALEPGKAEEDVQVFVKIDDTRIMLGTLSVDNHPHVLADLVFKEEFELFHSSMTSNISFMGYKFDIIKRFHSCTKQGADSDEEVPLAIPLDINTDGYKNNEATHGANNLLIAPRPADAPSSIPKAKVEETNSPGKQKGDDKDKTGMQNSSDGLDNESSDQDVDYPRKRTKDDYNPMETPLNTPQGKRAKIATPTTGNKTGYVHVATPHPAAKQARKPGDHVHVATPHPAAKQARKSGDHVHVATPHPAAKHARKTPENNDDKSKQSAGHVCNSCNRTFSSLKGLGDHSRAKHGDAK